MVPWAGASAALETASLGIDKLATIGLATMDDLTSSRIDESDSDGGTPRLHIHAHTHTHTHTHLHTHTHTPHTHHATCQYA